MPTFKSWIQDSDLFIITNQYIKYRAWYEVKKREVLPVSLGRSGQV